MKLIAWWTHNPIAANLVMLGILLSGFLGFRAMERETFPAFQSSQVHISIPWPGAAPQEVEEQILLRVEEALSNLDSVYRVYASASEGMADLNVTARTGVGIEEFVNQVKLAVDSVSALPRDTEKPVVRQQQNREEMIRVVVHGHRGEKELTRLAEDLRDEIAALPYISLVELFGTRREELTIEISEQDLRAYGLSMNEVASVVRASSVNLSSGRVRTETGDVLLRARSLAESAETMESIVLRHTRNGGFLRLGDVATVTDGFEDDSILATLNGEPAVLLQILTPDHMQIVKASDAVQEWMAHRQETLPDGITLSIWFDSADLYKSRMSLISSSALLGLVLVFLVLILTLRPRVALWVTAGIAVAFLGTFALLPASGVSLNIMSTFAFLLVLGIVVDDAIVVGESIHRYGHEQQYRQQPGVHHFAVQGAAAVAKPVVFAVLTTMIAFAPWFFLTTEEAQVTRQFSIVITLALTISLIEAFLILPAHLRELKKREGESALARWQHRIENGLMSFSKATYRRCLEFALANRYATVSVFAACFIVSVGLFSSGWVKFSFMPEVQHELIYVNVEMPTGTPYGRALAVLDQLQEAELKLIEEVDSQAAAEGGSGKLIAGWYTRSRRDSVIAIVKLVPPEDRDLSAKEAALRLRELVGEVPDADEIQVNYTMNNSTPQLSYVLSHPDMDVLREAAAALKTRLYGYEGTYYVRDNLQGEVDELHFWVKPGGEQLGVSLAMVSQQVRQAYFGEEVQRLPRENGDVKVMLKYPRAQRYSLESLSDFIVRTDDGREIPLFSIVDVELRSGVQQIQRQDGERTVRITAEVVGELMSDIGGEMNDQFIPTLKESYPELSVGKSGSQESEEQFINEIVSLYAVAFFVMYALIAVAFRSYWLPLLVMTAIPFGFMGAVFGHLLFGIPMAMFSYFGIGAAAGVVINDNLVLVDFISRLRDKGTELSQAVVDAGVVRFRPILLTSVTTFVGLMPIMAERSTDAEFLKPAVLSLAFGVLFALLVTLILVPALYCVGDDVRSIVVRFREWVRVRMLMVRTA